MAILYAEKFSKYASVADFISDNPTILTTSVAANGSLVAGGGRHGDAVFQLALGSARFEYPFAALTASTTIIVAASFNAAAAGITTAQNTIFQMIDAAGQLHWEVGITNTYQLYVVNANSSTLAYSSFNIGRSNWVWLEVKCDMNNSGNIQVRLNGVEVFNINSDFRNATSDPLTGLRVHGAAPSPGFWYDEVIICDDTGSTFNDFFGEMRLEYAVVDADGAVAAWTPSAGANYQCIDDPLGAYDKTAETYISSATTDQDNYASHATAIVYPTPDQVKFTSLHALLRDDGSNTFRLQVDSAGTIARDAADRDPPSAYAWFATYWPTNPATGLAWDLAAIDAAEFGIRCRP